MRLISYGVYFRWFQILRLIARSRRICIIGASSIITGTAESHLKRVSEVHGISDYFADLPAPREV